MPGNRLTLLCCLEGSTPEDGYLHQAKDIVVAPGEPFCTAIGSYFVSWGLRRSAGQDWELRHWAAAKTRLEQRPMTEGPRRYASQAPRNFLIYFLSPLSVVGYYPEDKEGLFLFIALRWMQDPRGEMVGLTENIQACLRIFRRVQHQWLSRDICIKRKGFLWFLSYDPDRGSRSSRGSKGSTPSNPSNPSNPW